MKIEAIRSKNICFSAGQVRVFSDFDRTFLPSSHSDFVKKMDYKFVKSLQEYFKDFRNFLDKTGKDLNFTITTGRTFGEFKAMAEIARKRGFKMPLPDSLIAKNGSDEYLRAGDNKTFYNGGAFPFSYDVTNKEKEKQIEKLSGWNGKEVKEFLYRIFHSHNLTVIEADSEHRSAEYGSGALFNIPEMDAENTIGLRRDGNLKAYIAYPCHETAQLRKEIAEEFRKHRIQYIEKHDKIRRERNLFAYEPRISSDTGLTKLYDAKEGVISAKKNNNLAIVSGNGSNDFEMLNPAEYLIEFIEDKALRSRIKEKINNPEAVIEELDASPELAKIYQKMPFIGIIVKDKNEHGIYEKLAPFTEGKYKKLIVTEQFKLKDGIEDAIKLYCKQNPDYEKNLSSDIKRVVDTNCNSGGNNGGDAPEKSNLWKYFIAGGGILLAGSGIYIYHKNKKIPDNR